MTAVSGRNPSVQRRRLRRVIAALFLFTFAALLLVVAFEPWRVERFVTDIETRRALPAQHAIPAWDPIAPRMMARRMLATGPYQPDTIQRHLETSIARRPLYAPTWVDLAQLMTREGNDKESERYLAVAGKLWPTRGRLLWRTAMAQITMGHNDRALNTLGTYLSTHPGRAHQVLTMARKLQSDPALLLQALTTGQSAIRVIKPILASAIHLKDAPLAHAAWESAPETIKQDPKPALPYLALLTAGGHREQAEAAWRSFTGNPARDEVYNPSFERPLTGGGFGWRAVKTAGVKVDRDCTVNYHGDCSLGVQFLGTDNVHFHHTSQIIPVTPGRTYRVNGYWRGDNITTRSGVFIEAFSPGAGKSRVRTPAKTKSWRWEPFSLDVTIPFDAEFLQLRVRRQKTDALDRIIAGKVWFDAITLTPLPPTTSKHE